MTGLRCRRQQSGLLHFELRKLLHPAQYIETVPRYGYRFVATVRNVFHAAASQAGKQ